MRAMENLNILTDAKSQYLEDIFSLDSHTLNEVLKSGILMPSNFEITYSVAK